MSLPQFWPLREHSLRAMTRIAPPAVRSARVAVPSVIFFTRLAFVVVGLGTFHTVASYRSRHTAPTSTASGPHVLAALAALVTSATARETIVTFRIIVVAPDRSSVHEDMVLPGGMPDGHALRRDIATPVPDARTRSKSAKALQERSVGRRDPSGASGSRRDRRCHPVGR